MTFGDPMKASPLAIVAAFLLAACTPTSSEPNVTSSSGRGTTVEYSGERSGHADETAQTECAKQGKRAVAKSMQPGPSGGSVRSYDCE
jgi:hypothetical protein